MFGDLYEMKDWPLLRKERKWRYHGGPALTRSEKRRMARIDKRAAKIELTRIGVLASLVAVVLGVCLYVTQYAH